LNDQEFQEPTDSLGTSEHRGGTSVDFLNRKHFKTLFICLTFLGLFLTFQNFTNSSIQILSDSVAEVSLKFEDVRNLWPYNSCEAAGTVNDGRSSDKMYFCDELPFGTVDANGSQKQIDTLIQQMKYCQAARGEVDNGDYYTYTSPQGWYSNPSCRQIFSPGISSAQRAKAEWSARKTVFSSNLQFQDRAGRNRSLPVTIRMDRQSIYSTATLPSQNGKSRSMYVDRVYGKHFLQAPVLNGQQYIEECSYFPGLRFTGLEAQTDYTLTDNWLFSYGVTIYVNPGSFKFDNAGICILGKANPGAAQDNQLFQVIGIKPLQLAGAQFSGLKIRVDTGWLGNFVLDLISRLVKGMDFNSLITSMAQSRLNTISSQTAQGMGGEYLSESEFKKMLSGMSSSDPGFLLSGEYLKSLYKLNVVADHNFAAIKEAVARIRSSVKDGSIQDLLSAGSLDQLRQSLEQKINNEALISISQKLSVEKSNSQAILNQAVGQSEADAKTRLQDRLNQVKLMINPSTTGAQIESYKAQLDNVYNEALAKMSSDLDQRNQKLVQDLNGRTDQISQQVFAPLVDSIRSSKLSSSQKDVLISLLNQGVSKLKVETEANFKSLNANLKSGANGRVQTLLNSLKQDLNSRIVPVNPRMGFFERMFR
jgi:hypothetical protein